MLARSEIEQTKEIIDKEEDERLKYFKKDVMQNVEICCG